MAIPFPDNIDLGVGNPIDSKYLNTANEPYSGETEVNTRISESQRYVGLTVNINNSEYWYKNGTTGISLIPKSLGGTSDLTGATNGLSLTGGGTQVALGGTLTGNTAITIGPTQSLTFCSGLFFTVAKTTLVSISGTSASFFGNAVTLSAIEQGTGCQNYIQLSCAGMCVVDDINLSGMSYCTDYSTIGGTCPRWIPDNAYVTGLTSSASNIVSVYNQTSTSIYSATTTNDFIGAFSGSTIYLPNSPNLGQRISVADISSGALSCGICICSDTLLIVGSQSATINTDYGSITFINNGNFWSTAAFIN